MAENRLFTASRCRSGREGRRFDSCRSDQPSETVGDSARSDIRSETPHFRASPTEGASPAIEPITPRKITIEMWDAGVKAFERWDPDREEPEAMVVSVYWAMRAALAAMPAGAVPEARIRREALLEAAKVAEADNGLAPHGGGNMDYGPNVARRIAAALRAIAGEGEPR